MSPTGAECHFNIRQSRRKSKRSPPFSLENVNNKNRGSPRGWSRPILVGLSIFFCLCLLPLATSAAAAGGPALNPYHTLGVGREATQEEIRKKYRQLCLKYHPDKNVGKSPEEQKRCEDAFKNVQKANSLIGTAESRRHYDSTEKWRNFSTARSRSSGGPSAGANSAESLSMDDILRHFVFGFNDARSSRYRSRNRYPYTSSPFMRDPFFPYSSTTTRPRSGFAATKSSSSSSTTSSSSEPVNPTAPQSIYVQRVKVPLEELYSGVSRKEFVLRENLWTRYRAAFRGGSAASVGLQSFFCALVFMIRLGWRLSALVFLVYFHVLLPKSSQLLFAAPLQAGWKGGTRLRFQPQRSDVTDGSGGESSMNAQVVFVLEEARHATYRRIGNDLQTSIHITPEQARKGCRVPIEALGVGEAPVTLQLYPRQVTSDNQVVVLKGYGWPYRRYDNIKEHTTRENDKETKMLKGDLHVIVRIDKRKRGRQRRPSENELRDGASIPKVTKS